MTTIREMKIETNDNAITVGGLQYVLRTMRYADLVEVAAQLEAFRKSRGREDAPETSTTELTAQMLSDWADT